MPSVVPMPEEPDLPRRDGGRASAGPAPLVAMNSTPVAMTTTLFSTGAQAGGPNTSREFRIAVNRAPMP